MTEKIYGYSFDLGNGMLAAYSVDDKTITLSNRNFNTQKYIESEARALCAALIECGFGPVVDMGRGHIRPLPDPIPYAWSCWCGNTNVLHRETCLECGRTYHEGTKPNIERPLEER